MNGLSHLYPARAFELAIARCPPSVPFVPFVALMPFVPFVPFVAVCPPPVPLVPLNSPSEGF